MAEIARDHHHCSLFLQQILEACQLGWRGIPTPNHYWNKRRFGEEMTDKRILKLEGVLIAVTLQVGLFEQSRQLRNSEIAERSRDGFERTCHQKGFQMQAVRWAQHYNLLNDIG